MSTQEPESGNSSRSTTDYAEEPGAGSGPASADRRGEKSDGGLNPIQVVGSVFAAGLGVQSSKNRERDFNQGRAPVFIAAGLIFTALFIGGVYAIVSIVLSGR